MVDVPIIAIGASLGGLSAIATVLKELSPNIPAAILAVIHIGDQDSQLPRYFRPRSPLPVTNAHDKEKIRAGRVYFAPNDRHLLVEDGRLLLSSGPKENHTRPAIDPLFRSAAEVYGPLVTGVILTGHLTDGTAGLWEVKRRGGIAVVQDPDEAEVPSMPQSALRHVAVDHCLKLKEIGSLLNRLAETATIKAHTFALHHGEPTMGYKAGEPVAFVCPDCGGALKKDAKGSYTQYRCHIGHTFGEAELAQAQFDALDTSLQQSIRLLNERRNLCLDAAAAARRSNQQQEVQQWEKAAVEAGTRFEQIERLLDAEWTRPELTTTPPTRDATAKPK